MPTQASNPESNKAHNLHIALRLATDSPRIFNNHYIFYRPELTELHMRLSCTEKLCKVTEAPIHKIAVLGLKTMDQSTPKTPPKPSCSLMP